ncbi:hypothetical protein [Microbacterium suwonense]|uniref:hypothetical protein n=1 Tax=Microbacterium suwonense TaxID=683047 RepID=UPI002572F005|nr:hypothetical protein [Microbacterium suwonense]
MVHVEVFQQMGSVRTSILEDLDPYPRTGTPTPSTAKSLFGVPSPGNQLAIVSSREVLFAPQVQAVVMDGQMAISGGIDGSDEIVLAQLELATAGIRFTLDEVSTIG